MGLYGFTLGRMRRRRTQMSALKLFQGPAGGRPPLLRLTPLPTFPNITGQQLEIAGVGGGRKGRGGG